MNADDRYYLEWALLLAAQSFSDGYSPVGAVAITPDGSVFPAASRREIGNIMHAEYRALDMAHRHPADKKGLVLYSTLEPCIMCSGMAAVMKASKIIWLVDDIWAGASRVYNPENAYIKARFPEMIKVDFPDLHKKAQAMWVEYLVKTGHADAVQFMLGLPKGYNAGNRSH